MPDTSAPVVQQLSQRPIAGAELERRRAENAELIELARPHLEWLSAAHQDVAHMVALVDRDGVILFSLARQLDTTRTPRLPGMPPTASRHRDCSSSRTPPSRSPTS